MKLKISEVNVGLEVEGNMEKRTVTKSNQTATREVLYAVPTLGLGLEGSFYHPNFLEYHLDTQDGVGWQESSFSGLGGGTRSGPLFLQRYDGGIAILKEKPYAANLFAAKERTTRDYDFFSRATVDTQRYGGHAGYTAGLVPVRVSATRSAEDITGLIRPSRLDETAVSLAASPERGSENQTEFSYTLDEFTRRETGLYTQEGINHSVNLLDTESFGQKDWIQLNSSLNYNQLDSTTRSDLRSVTRLPTSNFTSHEHLRLKHSKELESDYNYSFNQRSAGAVESDGHSASATVRHQLYESLTSTLDVHGQTVSSGGEGTALDTTGYGLGLNENYTKRLGKGSRLTLGCSWLLDREQRETLGELVFVTAESHTLKDGVTTVLNQPRVEGASLRVTDSSGTLPYRELLDYRVLGRGEQTEIQRVPGGTIPNGGTVLVDYVALAQPSDSFTTLAQRFNFRLDLLGDRLGLFGRLSFVDYYGGKSLILQEIVDQVVGLDLTAGWLRAGAEYEDFQSNLSPYTAVRLFQNLSVEPYEGSTFSLDVGETWSRFPEDGRKLTTYHFIGRSRLRLTSHLSINAEGGVRVQQGEGYDQTLNTARADLDFHYGKLVVQAGYEFQDENYLGELRERHFFFLRAKRSF